MIDISILEAVLFAAGEPLEMEKIAEGLHCEFDDVYAAYEQLDKRYSELNSGICVLRLGNKLQLCTKKDYNAEVRSVLEIKRNSPLSQAAFEVLAVIAYNQPVTKSFIEQVRGVDCSGVVSSLCEKGLIEEQGRLDLPGRPLLYGTTDAFLRCFSMSSLSELPPIPHDESENDNSDGMGENDGTEELKADDKSDNDEENFENSEKHPVLRNN